MVALGANRQRRREGQTVDALVSAVLTGGTGGGVFICVEAFDSCAPQRDMDVPGAGQLAARSKGFDLARHF